MNKKVKQTLLIFILALFIIVPIYRPQADSGFDGSYSGGSSSSWSGSSGSSWSSSSGSYHSSSSGTSDPIMTFIMMGIFLIIFAFALLNAKKYAPNMPVTTLKNLPPYDKNKLKELLPSFDETEFKNQTYEIYKKVQIAWMNFDYDSLRESVTDEMYNMYKSQLTTLKVKKQTNIMKDFDLLGFHIIGMEIKDKIISLTVTMQVECYDYITDNNKVVRGTDKRKVIYNYSMTFNKGISEKANKCPNCNAPLENVNSSVCPYCDSVIINENYDWVLSKKQVLSQRYK